MYVVCLSAAFMVGIRTSSVALDPCQIQHAYARHDRIAHRFHASTFCQPRRCSRDVGVITVSVYTTQRNKVFDQALRS